MNPHCEPDEAPREFSRRVGEGKAALAQPLGASRVGVFCPVLAPASGWGAREGQGLPKPKVAGQSPIARLDLQEREISLCLPGAYDWRRTGIVRVRFRPVSRFRSQHSWRKATSLGQDCRAPRLRRPRCSRRHVHHHPNADVDAPGIGIEPVTTRRSAVPGKLEPSPAAQHMPKTQVNGTTVSPEEL